MNTRNLIRVALALAGAAALSAACGVANPFTPAAATSNKQDQLLKFAQCMRQHGVNMPDPVNGAIRITVTPAPGQSPGADGPIQGNSQFQAAQNACKQYAPNGANGGRGPSQQQLDQVTKFAQCMRDHGIPMQDPKASGGGIQFQGGGPGIDPSSPQFQQAQQACQKYAPGGPNGGPKTSTGSGNSGVVTGG
jgi:hypothetical protein